jgi:hypothetical protein
MASNEIIDLIIPPDPNSVIEPTSPKDKPAMRTRLSFRSATVNISNLGAYQILALNPDGGA